MKNRFSWLATALLLSVLVILTVVLPASLAYVAANSNTLHNTFRLVYLPPESVNVPVRLQKTVLSEGEERISPEGFSFSLLNLTTGETLYLTSDQNGFASAILPFVAGDEGKTFAYRLQEINDGRENMTYDERIYEIKITLGVNDWNQLTADITINNEAVSEIFIEFENMYMPIDVPVTGDHSHPLLWMALLLLSGAGMALLMKQKIFCVRRP